jgi:hypothetical protein
MNRIIRLEITKYFLLMIQISFEVTSLSVSRIVAFVFNEYKPCILTARTDTEG